jgi:glutathione S-transferase
MAAPRRFFTMPISHYCVSVDRMIAFKGLSVERVPVPYHDKTELIRETGQDYVPALLWGDSVVSWKKIPDFLEAQQPAPTLYPKGWAAAARVLENWGHEYVEERVWRAVVTDVPATFRDPRERWAFEEMQNRSRGPWHVLEQRKPEFEADALDALGMVDALLAERPWVLGEPSVADFGIFGALSPWLTVGRSIPSSFSDLGRWVSRIQSLGSPTTSAQKPRAPRAPARAAK